jgi:protein associated with RNAse G/E
MNRDTGRSSGDLIVRVMKFDRREHRRWRASLLRREGPLLVLDARFAEEVRHSQLGLIERGTASIEYYWLDRWYNVFRFLEPDGSLRNFYCNVNLPPEFDGFTLTYVDLDIDIIVRPDFSYEILDRDEFEQNAERFRYPVPVIDGAERALLELRSMIESRRFPFVPEDKF